MSIRRRWAYPLVPIYGAALAAQAGVRDALQAAGLARARVLRWPVISVGSVSAGGAGKTPVVIALARLLSARGWAVDVLSRGYGRARGGVERVDVGADDAARRFGDEPVLIAERAEVPVWVGANRTAAGRAAERGASTATQKDNARPERHVHILDDGMQHRSLLRQFELAVVTEEDLRDTLLPAGNLREPLAALRRAHALAVREHEVEAVAERLDALALAEMPLWTVRRTLRFPAPLGVFGAGLRPLAFCGLARPENFAAMLTEAGCGIVDTVLFRDHHRYEQKDVTTLVRLAKKLQASGLVTTEKDAVKLSPTMRTRLEGEVGPLMVVRLETGFVYESPVVRALENRLRAARRAEERTEARVR